MYYVDSRARYKLVFWKPFQRRLCTETCLLLKSTKHSNSDHILCRLRDLLYIHEAKSFWYEDGELMVDGFREIRW
jgi:hypothetical protein